MGKNTVQGQSGTNHGKGASGFNQYRKTYVKCNLSDADKTAIKASKITPAALLDEFDKFLDSGHKVSTQWEGDNDCCGIYATQNDETHGNFPYCLTARGPSFIAAIKALLYKHSTLLEGDWARGAAQRNDQDGWG